MDIMKHELVRLVKNAVAHGAEILSLQDTSLIVVSEDKLSIMVKIRANAGTYPGSYRYFSVKVTEHN